MVQDKTFNNFILEFGNVVNKIAAHKISKKQIERELFEVTKELRELEAERKRLIKRFPTIFKEMED